MKRLVNVLLAMLLSVVVFATAVPTPVHAEFKDLKRSGVSFNLKPGNWTFVYTKLPGSKKYQKILAKITKYRRIPLGNSSGGSSSSSGGSSSSGNGVRVLLSVQVQLPRRLKKSIAKALLDRQANGLAGDRFVDYLDVVYVDRRTGENLKSNQTNVDDGLNYKSATVTESSWKNFKPQTVSWNGGSYSYYASYAKEIIIDFPTGYKNACVGVCGNCTNNYKKLTDWNEGFEYGLTVLSDTAHVKLGSKKKTAKISHMFRVK